MTTPFDCRPPTFGNTAFGFNPLPYEGPSSPVQHSPVFEASSYSEREYERAGETARILAFAQHRRATLKRTPVVSPAEYRPTLPPLTCSTISRTVPSIGDTVEGIWLTVLVRDGRVCPTSTAFLLSSSHHGQHTEKLIDTQVWEYGSLECRYHLSTSSVIDDAHQHCSTSDDSNTTKVLGPYLILNLLRGKRDGVLLVCNDYRIIKHTFQEIKQYTLPIHY